MRMVKLLIHNQTKKLIILIIKLNQEMKTVKWNQRKTKRFQMLFMDKTMKTLRQVQRKRKTKRKRSQRKTNLAKLQLNQTLKTQSTNSLLMDTCIKPARDLIQMKNKMIHQLNKALMICLKRRSKEIRRRIKFKNDNLMHI